jgi:hypothetical protein
VEVECSIGSDGAVRNISRTAEFVGMECCALHRKLRTLGVSSHERSGEARPA